MIEHAGLRGLVVAALLLSGTICLEGASAADPREAPATDRASTASAPSAGDLRQARQTLEKLERDAYAKNPRLREAEEQLATMRKQRRAAGQREWVVGRFLEAESKKRPETLREYDGLEDIWSRRVQAQFLGDPFRRELLRDWLTGDEARMAHIAYRLQSVPELANRDLTNKDVLWEAYAGLFTGKAKVLEEWFNEDAAKLAWPQSVFEQAKLVAEANLVEETFGAYVKANLPPEVAAARQAVQELEHSPRN